MVVFPGLLLLLGVWLGQALSAYKSAVAKGAPGGGELQIAGFLPLAVTVVVIFWLVGGMDGSPATVLGRYVDAWEDGKADSAAHLFAAPIAATDLSTRWNGQTAYLSQRVAAAAAEFPALLSGLDPTQPFNALRFTELPASSADTSTVLVEIVRRQRVETVLLGFIPTASQQTVSVEQLGTITLVAVPDQAPAWLGSIRSGARIWRIGSVDLSSD